MSFWPFKKKVIEPDSELTEHQKLTKMWCKNLEEIVIEVFHEGKTVAIYPCHEWGVVGGVLITRKFDLKSGKYKKILFEGGIKIYTSYTVRQSETAFCREKKEEK